MSDAASDEPEAPRAVVVGSVWSAGGYDVVVTRADAASVSYHIRSDNLMGSGTYTRPKFVRMHTWLSDPTPEPAKEP